MANIFERLVAVVSPAAAEKRARSAMRTESLRAAALAKREYTAALAGRRTDGWFSPRGASANSVIRGAAPTLRDRAHDLVRNNSYAQMIVSRHADNIIGDGITPKARTGSPENNKIVDDLFEAFSKRIDPEGQMNFYGLQYQAVRGMVSGGEVFLRRRIRRLTDGLKVPLQINLLESEFLDSTRQLPYSSNSRNIVRDGIEFDLLGGRRGYWMFQQHPSGGNGFDFQKVQSVFVPSTEIAHLYEPQRQQSRGVSWLATIMLDLKDLEDYASAEMLRKKTEACMVGVVIPGDDEIDDDEPQVGMRRDRDVSIKDLDVSEEEFDEREVLGPGVVDASGAEVERFEPGMFVIARGGKDIKFNNPSVSAGHEAWVRTQLRRIAAGARMPYEVMTGDLSLVNFASGKMGSLQYQGFVSSIQWNIVVPQICLPIWEWFVDAIKLAGLIPENLVVDVEWTVPRVQSINPKDDAQADQTDVRNGFQSWDEAVTKRGGDPDKVAAQIVARQKFWTEHGVILDSDPRYVSAAGQKHQADATAPNQGTPDAAAE